MKLEIVNRAKRNPAHEETQSEEFIDSHPVVPSCVELADKGEEGADYEAITGHDFRGVERFDVFYGTRGWSVWQCRFCGQTYLVGGRAFDYEDEYVYVGQELASLVEVAVASHEDAIKWAEREGRSTRKAILKAVRETADLLAVA